MKTFLTNQAKKNIIVLKYKTALHPGNESIALYIINTHPSCEDAWYTVKKLVTKKIQDILTIYFDTNQNIYNSIK